MAFVTYIKPVCTRGRIGEGHTVGLLQFNPTTLVAAKTIRILKIFTVQVINRNERHRKSGDSRSNTHGRKVGQRITARNRERGSVRKFHSDELQRGTIIRLRFRQRINPHDPVHAAEEQTSRVGALPIGIVAKLRHIEIRRRIVVEEVRSGVVLCKALVRTEPNAAVCILQNAVNHVVGNSVAPIELPDIASGGQMDQPRTGSAIEPRTAAAAQAQQIAQSPTLQALHVHEIIVLRTDVETYQSVTAAQTEQQGRIALADHRVKPIAVAASHAEPVATH